MFAPLTKVEHPLGETGGKTNEVDYWNGTLHPFQVFSRSNTQFYFVYF